MSATNCPCCGHALPEVDIRPKPARWEELVHLVDGARARKFTEDQLEYLRMSLGLAWTTALSRGLAQGGTREGTAS
jgi:hypothetical protein